jgi:hypothetical protein
MARGGAAHRRERVSGHEAARKTTSEHRESRVNGMRARVKEKRKQRGGFHGAGFLGELGQNSGERFARMGSLPRLMEVSAGCSRGRRSLGQDGAACGELGLPERARPVMARGGGNETTAAARVKGQGRNEKEEEGEAVRRVIGASARVGGGDQAPPGRRCRHAAATRLARSATADSEARARGSRRGKRGRLGPGRGGEQARARGSGAGRFRSRAETGAAACLG